MKQSKNRFLIASAAAAIAAMLATASILSGCGGSGEGEAKETKVITETQIVTKVVNGVYTDEEGNIIKDSDGQPMTAPSGTPDTDAKEKSESEVKENKSGDNKSDDGNSGEEKSDDNKSSDSKSSDSKSSDSKSSDSKSSGSKSSGSKSSKSEGGSGDVLKVGGESFNVGDEITCVYELTSPDYFINFQATLNYDGSVLKATGAKMQGDASTGSVVNYKLDSKVKFNGINLNGYDYTEGGKFMYVTYEVIGTGSTSPKISWEIVTDEKNNAMVVNGDIKSSFKITESWE